MNYFNQSNAAPILPRSGKLVNSFFKFKQINPNL